MTSVRTGTPAVAGTAQGRTVPPAFAPEADLSNLRLVVAWRSSQRHLQLRQVELARDLQLALTDAARNSLAELHRRRIVDYNAEITLTRDECALANASHLDPDSLVLQELGQLSYPPATGEDLEREFQFFAYLVGPPDQPLVFISKFNPRRGLRRKRILRWVEEQLTELDDPVLAFDPERVDLIWSLPDAMVILDLAVFEFLLRDAPEVIAKVPTKVAQLASAIPFGPGSADALTQASVADTRLRRRLLAITERGHLVGKNIDDLRRAFRHYGYSVPDFVDSSGLIVTADTAATVLQVLNEDILRGEFSGERFAAERKSPT
jgi:hypothetical protein